MLIVGLTGNYGMGKSTVLGLFGTLGAVTLSTDEIVHELLKERPVLDTLREILGNDVFSREGHLERNKVAAAIFHDSALREAVEEVLHPRVFEKIADFLNTVRAKETDERVVIIEIPLLFEKGYGGTVHRTITVFVNYDIAMMRLEKAGIKREDALARLSVQMPVREKVKMSDFAIDNSHSIPETEAQVKAVYAKLLEDLKCLRNTTVTFSPTRCGRQ